jgi:hypothetical protein
MRMAGITSDFASWARITKSFEISRYPCDDHQLTINIENPGHAS